MKKPSKNNLNKLKLYTSFAFVVLFLLLISIYWLFLIYAILNALPYIDANNLPKYTNDILLILLSMIMGVVLGWVFKRFILDPLSDIYETINAVSEGDFSVKIKPKGINPIKSVSEKINAMTDELDSTETLRNDFISNFSHEFKTPIVSIEGFAKMLRDKNLSDAEREEYLDIIISESHRLAELSNNILFLNRLENQTIASGKTEFNVSEQIRLVVATLYRKCTEKNITVEFNGSDYSIFANENLLQQLWINLTDNAIKYSEEGGSVEIYASKKADNLVFRFVDHGKGMTESVLQHAFDKFYQGDLNHKSVGNGIGLPVAKKICELHGGEIRILHTEGGGVTAEVMLPCLLS